MQHEEQRERDKKCSNMDTTAAKLKSFNKQPIGFFVQNLTPTESDVLEYKFERQA